MIWAMLFRAKLSCISHVEGKKDSTANGWGMAVHQREGGGSWGWRLENNNGKCFDKKCCGLIQIFKTFWSPFIMRLNPDAGMCLCRHPGLQTGDPEGSVRWWHPQPQGAHAPLVSSSAPNKPISTWLSSSAHPGPICSHSQPSLRQRESFQMGAQS